MIALVLHLIFLKDKPINIFQNKFLIPLKLLNLIQKIWVFIVFPLEVTTISFLIEEFLSKLAKVFNIKFLIVF